MPTRTATGPASASTPAGGGLAAAMARVNALGFTVADRADYHPGQTLRVLIGFRRGSADARVQRAFFFLGDRYLGTDTGDTSAAIRVGAQDDTSVTLIYGLYRRGDPLCCPTGGSAKVRFALDNGRLAPQQPIPSSSPSAPLSRQ